MKTIMQILPAMLLFTSVAVGQIGEFENEPTIPDGGLSEEALGKALKSIGLKPIKTDKRYDFAFKTSVRGEEWKFSMSAVLSRNSQTVWVMAWLDEIPTKSTDVPRTALLKLLAANDRLGNGKFFAYIPTNKRFVLQRVVPNQQLNSKKLMGALQDLALSVADEYPTWAVAKWAPQTDGSRLRIAGSLPPQTGTKQTTTANQSAGTRTSESGSKFSNRRIE